MSGSLVLLHIDSMYHITLEQSKFLWLPSWTLTALAESRMDVPHALLAADRINYDVDVIIIKDLHN